MTETVRLSLAGSGAAGPGGVFEVLAITAGVGNGYAFGEDALRESLSLWDGAECFVDHARWGHSLRDLAGVCFDPAWDAGQRGVTVKLRAVGPSGPLLAALGKEMLAEDETDAVKPRVGFSADVLCACREHSVEKIVKVFSLDLVFNPARGGAFKRAINSVQGGSMAEDSMEVPAVVQEMRDSLNRLTLEAGLREANLPPAVAEMVRGQFEGRAVSAEELRKALDAARKLVSDLTGRQAVQGPARLNMVDSTDRIRCAVDDLFDVPRDPGLEHVQAARLSGVRELYMMLTGDYDLHGGYYADRVQMATSADFTGLVKNAMNKIVANTWERLGRAGYDWWRKVARVEHFTSLQTITGTLVGTVGALPSIAEGAEYPQLPVGDSPETASFVKYGGYIPLTLELIDRDETFKLREYPRELASAGLRRISALVAAIFTANSGAGPSMADGGALFNSTAVTTAGGHANLRTTALSANEWDTVCTAGYNQPMLIKNETGLIGTGPKLALNPRYLLVPRALQLAAMKILYPSLENAASIYSENQQRGQPGDVVTVPEWTDATDWAAVCDPTVVPAVFVGERFGVMPEVFIASDERSPAVFMNDEHRLKVRQFVAVWVNDFRPLHKSNVAG